MDDLRYRALGQVHGGSIDVGVEVDINQGKQKNAGLLSQIKIFNQTVEQAN